MLFGSSNLFLALLAIPLTFAVIIWLSLRSRKRFFAKNLSLKAKDFLPALFPGHAHFPKRIYSLVQDFSFTETGLIVRNEEDSPIGKVIGHSTGIETIECEGKIYETQPLPVWGTQSIELHLANDLKPICTFERRSWGDWWGEHRFQISGVGTLAGTPDRKLSLYPRLWTYTLNGKIIAIARAIGRSRIQGSAACFAIELPLPIQIFILRRVP